MVLFIFFFFNRYIIFKINFSKIFCRPDTWRPRIRAYPCPLPPKHGPAYTVNVWMLKIFFDLTFFSVHRRNETGPRKSEGKKTIKRREIQDPMYSYARAPVCRYSCPWTRAHCPRLSVPLSDEAYSVAAQLRFKRQVDVLDRELT
jgi:hypothetical protein